MSFFASLDEIYRETMGAEDSSDLLARFLDAAGVRWHQRLEEDGFHLVASPAVKTVSLGGIPFVGGGGQLALAISPDVPFDIGSYRAATERMMGYSGMMSYLNSGRKSADEMFSMLAQKGELSVAHAVSVGILVAGVSVAVENEFNSQRDLVHLARVTVARSAIQNSPPLVVHDSRHVPAFRQALALARQLRDEAEVSGKDGLEAINLIYPAAKATAFVMTASLRNFMKLLQQESDQGKERELRSVLSQVRDNLKIIWPGIF
jgi:hypothetical protein